MPTKKACLSRSEPKERPSVCSWTQTCSEWRSRPQAIKLQPDSTTRIRSKATILCLASILVRDKGSGYRLGKESPPMPLSRWLC